MLIGAAVVWIVGLLTIVPFGTYYLFYHAHPDLYAPLIVLVLFWVFGYWALVGPILAAVKVHRVLRLIETAHAEGRLMEALRGKEAEDTVIDLIAAENKIPRFLAVKVYRHLIRRFATEAGAPDRPPLVRGEVPPRRHRSP